MCTSLAFSNFEESKMHFSLIFFELMSSFFVFHHLLSEIRSLRRIEESIFIFFHILFLFWVGFFAFFMQKSFILLTIFIWLPPIICFFLPWWCGLVHKSKFRDEILPLLDRVLLNMQQGMSFRLALKESINGINGNIRTKFEKILDQLTIADKSSFDSQQDPLVYFLQSEFRKIESETHLAILRVSHLRNQLKVAGTFRSKQQRAVGPVRAQIMVLSILYALALGYLLLSGRFWGNGALILVSIILYVLGMLISIYFTRSFQWRV
jgi:hypothetical protein